MKRKIVQHGNSSLTVTLPFGWIRQYDLKKGDDVDVEVKGSQVVISTGVSVSTQKKVASTSDFGFFTKNNLTHLYQNGYDEVEIRFQTAEELEGIKQRLQECLGYEIIDQRKNTIYIKSIAQAMESDFDILLRKAFLITKEMGVSLLEALRARDFKKLGEIRNFESINNKLTLLCIRILMKRGYKEQNRICQIYSVIKQLERICDEYKHTCDLYKDANKPLEKGLLDYLAAANQYYDVFYKLFYKFDADLKKSIYLDGKRLRENGERMLRTAKGNDAVLLHHLLELITKTYEGAAAYFALIL